MFPEAFNKGARAQENTYTTVYPLTLYSVSSHRDYTIPRMQEVAAEQLGSLLPPGVVISGGKR